MNASRLHSGPHPILLGLGAVAAAATLTACGGETPGPEPIRAAAVADRGGALELPLPSPAAVVEVKPATLELPESAWGCYDLGLKLRRSGDLENAERALARAAEIDPAFLKTWINLARVRMDRGELTEALEAADAALALEAASVEAAHQRARALAALGRRDEAIACLTQARAAAPGHGYLANTLGWLLVGAGRYAEAVPVLEDARTALPGVAYVRNNLGVAYERTGRREEALAEYRAAVAAGDSGGKAAASLARLLPGKSEDRDVADVSAAAVAVRPGDPERDGER